MRRALTIVLGFSTASIIACGPRYRVEPVGSGVAHLGAPASDLAIEAGPAEAASPGTGDVAIRERGLHRVSVQLRLPHALRVHYELHCPGSITAIDDGETMEQYRTRRIAELERERERQKRTAGALTGAVLGTVGAAAAVETPNASAQASAEVDGAAVGEAVAESAIPQVQLDPRDVGARVISAKHQILVDGPGRCALRVSGASPEDDASGVTGSFSVERLIDIKAEQHQARVAARKRAVSLRADVTASLVAHGADPHKRDRERAAARTERERVLEVKLQAERIARAERDRKRQVKLDADRAARAERERVRRLGVQAERTARVEVTARAEARVETAMTTRSYVIAWLGRCGGDPYRRDRERAALQQRQDRERVALQQREQARVRLTMEVRGNLRANLMTLGADPEHRRKQFEAETAAYEARVRAEADARRRAELALAARTEAVLDARATLKGELQANGAVDRPPRPAPIVETRPPMPGTNAVWITGSFEWTGLAWQWRAGYWTAPPQRDAIWIAPVEVIVRGTAVIRPGAWVDPSGKRVRDHRKR